MISTLLAMMAGWFTLVARFPNRSEKPLLRLWFQSGAMGFGVAMRGILMLSACPSGLRVGILRLFGPFCRDFFVPWEDISVRNTTFLFTPMVTLSFGSPEIGLLRVSEDTGDRLARAAAGRWSQGAWLAAQPPRSGIVPLLAQWAWVTLLLGAIFSVFSQYMPPESRPPVVFCFLLPAIVMGVVTFFRVLRTG
ncbi:MAG: hypothetical protein ABR975_09845 [Vulcanimicrobiaceae bacterium]